MRYEDIYINDFGIFANTKLIDLNPNFNIIGGGNRAGKTTFLKLLRYIGYGIPNTDSVPPARHSYDLEAILSDEKSRYSLSIDGYARPKINDLNNEQKDLDEIFSGVDQFTYNQLFTITLEELKKIPSGVSDTEKLQSVLMGAGLKEYTLIPQLKEYFKGNAKDIAGKYGKISVGSFKQYNQIIEEGIELKEEAQRQVNEYYNLKEEFKTAKEKIDEKVEKKDMLRKEKRSRIVDLLKPVSNVHIVDRDSLIPNNYNPNKVIRNTLDLLVESILNNGWTLPIVCRNDYTIVDGFHRWMVSGEEPLLSKLNGKVPVVFVSYEDDDEGVYGTITHNRARGVHLLEPMEKLVQRLLKNGKTVLEVSKHLGMKEEEIYRLSGMDRNDFLRILAKDVEYSSPWVDKQV